MNLPKTLDALNRILHDIDHELGLLSRTHKYDWISKRLLVLRNVIIASLLVLVTMLVVVVMRELTKNALVIYGFDVPASLEDRGITSRAIGYTRLGRAQAAQGDMRGAEKQFKRAAELGPKRGDPHHYWCEMFAANGDHAGAIKKHQQALALHPKWGEPYALWGDALAAQGDAASAKEKYAKALELEPKHPDFQKYRVSKR